MDIRKEKILSKTNTYKIKIDNLFKLTFLEDNTIDLFFLLTCHEEKYLLFLSTKHYYNSFDSVLFFSFEEFKKELIDDSGITVKDILSHYSNNFKIEEIKNDELIVIENSKSKFDTTHFTIKPKEKIKLKEFKETKVINYETLMQTIKLIA